MTYNWIGAARAGPRQPTLRGWGLDGLDIAEQKVWFVMVRDGRGRHKNSPLWGDGWLWALCKADAPSVNVAKSYRADYLGCHLPAAKSDRVFIDGYPILRRK